MNFDFELLLVIATAVSGLIWAVYAVVLKRQRANAKASVAKTLKEPLLMEYARSFFPVLVAVLVLRSFFFEPFKIPSGSMIPTLWIDDFILVNKFSYGVRLPVGHQKILETSSPSRGDVAVFRYPENPSLHYIKRIVGVPGDVISYHDKQLKVNGEVAVQEEVGPYTGPEADADSKEFREQLGDVQHSILLGSQRVAREGDWVVPEGYYFAMGDNRDHSSDSRYWGFVPEANLVGKAVVIWMNWNMGLNVEWSRIGNIIN